MWMRMGRRGMGLFDGVVGQPLATAILTNALNKGAAHAYLFAGPRGVGKTGAALAFAAALLCLDMAAIAVRPAGARAGVHLDLDILAPEGSFIRVDEIRNQEGRCAQTL